MPHLEWLKLKFVKKTQSLLIGYLNQMSSLCLNAITSSRLPLSVFKILVADTTMLITCYRLVLPVHMPVHHGHSY